MFVTMCGHDYGADKTIETFKSFQKAVDDVHSFFESYGGEIKNGRPFDDGNATDDDPIGGYSCYTEVSMYNGKVCSFIHCDGEGPVARIDATGKSEFPDDIYSVEDICDLSKRMSDEEILKMIEGV